MSVIQLAVDGLKVEHILVVGHYGCGGVDAALNGLRIGLSDNWIRHVGDVAQKPSALLEGFPKEQRANRLCELNAIEQAEKVCLTPLVPAARPRGQKVTEIARGHGRGKACPNK